MKTKEDIRRFCIEIAEEIMQNPDVDIEEMKMRIGAKYKISMIKNARIISLLPKNLKTKLVIKKLGTRFTRTGSGVTPIALMPKPFPCPGRCTYCPTAEIDEESGQMRAPKAYTGFEPATMRAIQNKFDAKKQIEMRISQYEALGQATSKCELIVMGGTFLSVPLDYQNKFIHQCYDALNGKKSKTIAGAQKMNEKAKHRMIGMTIETRPDWCKEAHIDRMLTWGATRVELGVQTIDDEVLEKVQRGHDVAETVRATKDLKNSGFKVCYHFMPGLYSSRKKDVEMLGKLFSEERFCPDMLKLYPCLVMPGTKLYNEWKAGRFEPIGSEEAVERIVLATKYFPPWVRIMRMQRDIPAGKISDGVKNGNLHQMVSDELERRGMRCQCIRCREIFSMQRRGKVHEASAGFMRTDEKDNALNEIGFESKMNLETDREENNDFGGGKNNASGGRENFKSKMNFGMVERKYNASGGMEHFISFEDGENDLIAGFVRLRFHSGSWRKEITDGTALIRELHVYGSEIGVDTQNLAKKEDSAQHMGFGKKLLERAEEIAREDGKEKMAVISGVGAREYYRKLGYSLEGAYMCKKLV